MRTLLIDGNSLVYRAYFGITHSTEVLTNSHGIPVNAVLSFSNMLSRILTAYKPTHVLIAFDAGKMTRRHEKLPTYKANRAATPPELIAQFPLIKKMLDLLNVQRKEIEGIEADDIIATMASKLPKNDNEIFIVSTDRDLFQMVSDNVSMIVPQNFSKPDLIVTTKNFVDVLGCAPEQVPDLKGIMGDPSDNLEGVKGIGKVGALKLIHDFGTLENVYESMDQLSESIKNKLIASKDMAFLCKELATLDKSVDLGLNQDKITYKKEISSDFIDYLKGLELKSLVRKFEPEVKQENLENIIL